ncbi:MAG TPA: alpha/beta hydrolase-fold protein [Vicinamibacterales bacterium]|nr:alpha/beta hydrolase-fold protein [Vicinamibacterales bacterium]
MTIRTSFLFVGLALVSSLAHAQGSQGTGPAAPPPLQPNPKGPLYQRTGEQYRVYEFPGTGESIPYRLFVPSRWKPGAKLPLLVTLRAGQSVDNPYRDPNTLVSEAERRGYLVVTPMGYRPLRQPYYGSKYKIARPNAAEPADGWTPQEDERAEQDVLNVIDLVTKEYGVDTARIYLHGQNPSGSGALHLGAKYPDRFAALVISSGPIVYDTYPFDRLKGKVALLVIHGDQDTTNPMEASKRMAEAAKAAGVNTVYATVPGGTHLAAYLTYASQIFDFLDAQRKS